MGKYEPLTKYLKDFRSDAWTASFAEIEKILNGPLPDSARGHRSWWANAARGHSQAKGWMDAGWWVDPQKIDLKRGRVRFVKAARSGPRAENSQMKDLRKRAMAISGITKLDDLEQAALEALIQRETARYIASLGGSMPDAEAPPRRRFE